MTTIPLRQLTDDVAIPELGFGTWKSSGDEAYRAVRHALEVGYRHIDTARMYRNEAEVGRAIADSGLDRREVFVTTKLLPDHVGREREALEESLRALGMDYVDLWLVHWPPHEQAWPDTWRELIAARDAGLTRAIGVSNYSPEQIDELTEVTGETPAVNQIPWSPSLHDSALLAAHAERGVAVEGYSPFRRSNLEDPVLTEVAAAHGVTVPQVIVRWHLQHGVIVIPKSVTPERIEANFDVFGFTLTDEEVRRIDGLSGR